MIDSFRLAQARLRLAQSRAEFRNATGPKRPVEGIMETLSPKAAMILDSYAPDVLDVALDRMIDREGGAE